MMEITTITGDHPGTMNCIPALYHFHLCNFQPAKFRVSVILRMEFLPGSGFLFLRSRCVLSCLKRHKHHFRPSLSVVSAKSTHCKHPAAITSLALLLLVAQYLANKKWCKIMRNDWNPGTWVLIWEYRYSGRPVQRIPIWQGSDGFQKYLHHCALDESSLNIRRNSLYLIDVLTFPLDIFRCYMTEQKARNVFCFTNTDKCRLLFMDRYRLGALVLFSSPIEIVHGCSLKPKVTAGRVRSIYKVYEWLRKGRGGEGEIEHW